MSDISTINTFPMLLFIRISEHRRRETCWEIKFTTLQANSVEYNGGSISSSKLRNIDDDFESDCANGAVKSSSGGIMNISLELEAECQTWTLF
ncbi:hypothetical protein EAF00_003031 [Botryotinia globosa]|nr:hypothetical protein EAF00_003031 [Botryotinia globosa]